VAIINIQRSFLLLSTIISLAIFLAGLVIPAQAKTRLPMQLTELLESDSAPHDNYGIVVALSSDTAVIGVPFESSRIFNAGSAYVYRHSNGAWSLQQKLQASDSAPGDQYGWSIALQGGTLLIGARFDDDRGFNSGSIYAYTLTDGIWVERQKFSAPDGAVNDQYGSAISLDGDLAFIGTPFDDDNGFESGSVYIYERTAGLWAVERKITAHDGEPGDQFGWSVALSAGSALIGARFDDDEAFNSGSAYLYNRTAQTWHMKQKFTASDAAVNDQFGWTVALDDKTAVIGARFNDDMGINSGSAYVYTLIDKVWSQHQKLTASDGESGNQYSWAIALDGDKLIIGAPFDNYDEALSGSCYVYSRSDHGWSEQQKLTANIEVLAARYGISVALEGDTTLIGACLEQQRGALSESPPINTTCVPLIHETTNLFTLD
jgi:FG-GAP repeat